MQSNLPAGPASASPPSRRVPTQARSRERVERMLASATTLIAQKGSDALRMSEVAELAGVSIGSLYQFFPDKSSLIRTLAERYNAEGVACVRAELAPVTNAAELRAALERVVDGYYEMFLAEPVMRDLWWATQADKTLQDVDDEDMRAHTTLLRDVLVRLHPGHDPAALGTLALLTMQLVATAVRLAISVDRAEGDAVVATFKRMLPTDLAGTLG
jgi:AcrR family transcriptional regulator